MTFCITNSNELEKVESQKKRFFEIGQEIYADSGIDALENMFFALNNRIEGEINTDASKYKSWWNGITEKWNF
ncbi:MAG TPA: hypothetical protein VF242_01270 [Nitrososphaeraceae archaeon]